MATTVAEALKGADPKLRGISDSPGADAQLLLGEAIGKPRAWILAHPEHEVNGTAKGQFDAMLSEVAGGVALPHVLGWWEFYGRRFELDQTVLIPRPETELMIDVAILLTTPKPSVIEIGTGSGCIAITLTLEVPEAKVLATDISIDALRVAGKNVRIHEVSNTVDLICTDLAQAIRGRFDLVCANLPYIDSVQLESLPVGRREPSQALDGGRQGLELIRRSIAALPELLEPHGLALFEIDPDQASTVLDWVGTLIPFAEAWIETDLAGRQRLLVIRRD